MPGRTADQWRGVGIFAVAVVVAAWIGYDSGFRLYNDWRARGDEGIPVQEAPRNSGDTVAHGYDVARIVSAHLFGESGDPVREAPSHVPETRLQINLQGLIASADRELARAFIGVSGSRTKSYSIGDQIDRTDAAVEAVESNRVLLKRGGTVESLLLKQPDYKAEVTRTVTDGDEGDTASLPQASPLENEISGSGGGVPDSNQGAEISQDPEETTIQQDDRTIELRKPF